MLYRLSADRGGYEKVKRTTFQNIGWTEKDFETLLSRHMNDFVNSDDLLVISNERRGQEAPDILALDKNGDLCIFELKRWKSHQENLLQVLRYGQICGCYDYGELDRLYRETFKQNVPLSDAHREIFNTEIATDAFNQKQRFIIVTNGLDGKTIDAILYWRSLGLDVDAVLYWIYDIGGEYHIEFDMYSPIKNFIFNNDFSAYLLNTNVRSGMAYQESMLKEKKAAAYCSPWKTNIERLEKNDRVFLYESGVGIIAYGVADGIVNKVDCDGEPEAEYNMKLNPFHALKTPMPAQEIRQVVGRLGHRIQFRKTMSSMHDEACAALIAAIERHHL